MMTIAAPQTMEEIHSVFSFGLSVQVVHNYCRLKDHTCKGHNSKDTEHLQEIYNTFFFFFLGGGLNFADVIYFLSLVCQVRGIVGNLYRCCVP